MPMVSRNKIYPRIYRKVLVFKYQDFSASYAYDCRCAAGSAEQMTSGFSLSAPLKLSISASS